MTRRSLLRASAAAGAYWVPVGAVPAGAGEGPAGFPAGIEVHRRVYENWAGQIRVDGVWTCLPRSTADAVAVVNWAYGEGWSVRPCGYRHGWAPLTVTADGAGAATTMLLDTTAYLTGMQIVDTAPGAVRVQAGASMDALLAFLEDAGLGVTNTPAPGDLSVGGVLAINGHGTSVPADGESPTPGHTYGSLSNLVLSLTAVVWDAASGRYAPRVFDRADPDCAAFATHVGRALVTEATLRVGADQRLRCLSRVDIPAGELFAAPGGGAGRTLASFVAEAGRVEAIWFVFTDKPWLKVWSVAPDPPLTSRPVVAPYNYPFSDNVPEPVSDLAERLLAGEWQLTPAFGQLQYTSAAAGLAATASADLWGASKNLLLYVRPTTLRETANGYAVHTRRASIQRVVSEFAAFYTDRLAAYQARGLFPVTGQVEIRVGGTDQPADAGVPGEAGGVLTPAETRLPLRSPGGAGGVLTSAETRLPLRSPGAAPPALSAARPRADHPEWDVVVWFDVLTFASAPGANEFYREMEAFFFTNYTGSYATTRVEWSKGWGYTAESAWAEPAVVGGIVPDSYRQGPDPTWDRALATLDAYDPHRVFTNAFLDTLMPPTSP